MYVILLSKSAKFKRIKTCTQKLYYFSPCIPYPPILHLSCLEDKPTGLTGKHRCEEWRSRQVGNRGKE